MIEPITLAVEGVTDEAVVRRLLADAGLQTGPVYRRSGKHSLDPQLAGYNSAARFSRWLVLRDLDDDAPCAPALTARLLPRPTSLMRLQIAVHAVEAWLMGDPESLGAFLGVGRGKVPPRPEVVVDPKKALIDLARHSRRRAVREEIPPPLGSRARVGPGYAAALIEYATAEWRPAVAAVNCESLARLRRYLSRIPKAQRASR